MTDLRRRSHSRRHRVAASGLEYIQFQTTCTAGDTFDPSVTLATGCPYTAHWDFGNGDDALSNTPSYTGFTDAGPHTVTLRIPNMDYWLTGIDVRSDKITGDFLAALVECAALTDLVTGENTALASDLATLAPLTNLVNLDIREHQISLTGDIASLAGLPNLQRIYIGGCGVHGDIASLAGLTGLTHLDLHSNVLNGGVSGDLGDIAALTGLTYLSLGNTYVTATIAQVNAFTSLTYFLFYSSGGVGCGAITGNLADLNVSTLYHLQLDHATINAANFSLANCPGLKNAYVNYMGWDQAQVDAFLAQLYADRAAFNNAAPVLLIHQQAEPSGTYQDGDPPTTGKEYIYELCNDPESEGFNPWTITYQVGAGSETKP